MLTNNLKIALRQLWKNRFYSVISIAGLSVSLACCLLMGLYLRNEWTYDKWHHEPDKVFRVVFDNYLDMGNYATTPLPVGPAMLADFPEVEAMTRMAEGLEFLVQFEDKKFFEKLTFVDTGLTKVFDIAFVSGNPSIALHQPNQLIISQRYAEKYFGSADPIGKTLKIGSNGSLNSVVAGVFRNFPENSTVQFDIALPFSTFQNVWGAPTLWRQMPNNFTFLRLSGDTKSEQLVAKLPEFVKTHVGSEVENWEKNYQMGLQPLTSIHLYSKLGREPAQGDIRILYLFASIALLVLLVAGINYVNYATARFSKRAKEVSVRKVVGASRKTLIYQFIGETQVLTIFAGAAGVILSELLLPLFNNLVGKNFSSEYLRHPFLYAMLVAMTLAVGIGAGIFPALFLSGFQPFDALKGKFSNLSLATFSRKGLVVAQFTVSIALLSITVLVWQQMDFVRQKIRPVQEQQVVVFQLNSNLLGKYETIKQQLLAQPGVKSVSAASNVATFNGDSWPVCIDLNSPKIQTENYAVEDDFFETLGYEIIAGRALSKTFESDVQGGFVLNETACHDLGFYTPERAIGQTVLWGGDHKKKGTVVGVVKDFHFQSLHDKIKPTLFQFAPFEWMTSDFMVIRFDPLKVEQLSQAIQNLVASIDPSWHADLKFLDDNFMALHEKDIRNGQLFAAFGILAVLISCLGLLGLAAFAAEQRFKEIGIRKILGASAFGIVGLLSKDFLKLVAFSLLLASPLAWYVMHHWLENFVYHVNIQWWVFFVSGGLATLVAFLTVALHSVKAALANPTDSLRSE